MSQINTEERPMEVEGLLNAWFSGQNRLKIQFDAEPDDLSRFVTYFSSLPLERVEPTLEKLLISNFTRNLKRPIKMNDVIPVLQFLPIHVPYSENYDRLDKKYQLSRFVDNTQLDIKFDMEIHGDGGKPIYLCIIQMNWIKIVNFLPALK